jgi:hypothetical protein
MVTVTIRNSHIVFGPSYVPPGTIAITVFNGTPTARDFGAGAKRTGAIAAGGSAKLIVTLAGKGKRTFSSVAKTSSRSGTRLLTGALFLFKPCPDPATTTVNVSMATQAAGGLTLSQTRVPCGTVTFDVTDVNAPGTSLLVSTEVPPLSDVTDQLAPGETATMTLRFEAQGVADCEAVADSEGGTAIVGFAPLTLF